jgi:hypothetical protein
MKLRIVGGLAGLALLSGAVGASADPAPNPPGEAEVAPPIRWVRKPDTALLERVLPNDAIVAGRDGGAVLECTLSRNGWLKQCIVAKEEPAGLGFGQTALAISVYFKFEPTAAGQQIGDRQVRIPLKWKVAMGGTINHDVVTTPVWLKAPTAAQVRAAYPPGMTGDGRVLFECQFDQYGGVEVCKPRLKDPEHGFVEAARSLLPYFKAPTTARGGRSTLGAHVFVPVQLLDPKSPDLRDSPIGNRPMWRRTPDAGQIVFPEAARAKGLRRGRGDVDCLVAPEGELTDCRLAGETPAGAGFGPAALAGAPGFALSAWSFDGRPLDGFRIKLPISMVDDRPETTPAT